MPASVPYFHVQIVITHDSSSRTKSFHDRKKYWTDSQRNTVITGEKYDEKARKISNYKVRNNPPRRKGGIFNSSYINFPLSAFWPTLLPCPPLGTICMNNESLNESRRREVDEKIQNVRDACVEARVLITNIYIYIHDTPEAFAFRKLYV